MDSEEPWTPCRYENRYQVDSRFNRIHFETGSGGRNPNREAVIRNKIITKFYIYKEVQITIFENMKINRKHKEIQHGNFSRRYNQGHHRGSEEGQRDGPSV